MVGISGEGLTGESGGPACTAVTAAMLNIAAIKKFTAARTGAGRELENELVKESLTSN